MRQKAGGWFWDETAEEAFFETLAASCNVTAAAEAAGFATPTVYRMRQKQPEFAARWQAALEQGYARLEMALLQAANDSIADKSFDAERPIPKMTVEQAMNVLRAHRHMIAGDGRAGPGAVARRRSLDEVRAEIVRKVTAIRGVGGEGAVEDVDVGNSPSPGPSRKREGRKKGGISKDGRGKSPSRVREGLGEGLSGDA